MNRPDQSFKIALPHTDGTLKRAQTEASNPWKHHAAVLAQAEEKVSAEHATNAETHEKGGHEEKAGFHLPEEFPNLYSLISVVTTGKETEAHGIYGGPFQQHGFFLINPLFSTLYAVIFVVMVRKAFRRRSIESPSRAQIAVELLFGGLMTFFGDILGEKHARKYVPFVGTMWLFIFLNNLFGLVPLLKAPTATFWTTIGLGLCTFGYVNYNGIKEGGIGHYLWHLCGSPESVVAWCIAPLMFILEVIGTLIKPISLSLRLAGNLFGEDKLLAAFMGFGMIIVSLISKNPHPIWGIPLHTPFLFLALLTCVIQATVFAMLSTVYIQMVLPHEHHEHIEEDEKQEGTHPIVA